MKYLVTGATGRFAGYAIKELSELVGVSQIVGTVRSLDKAHKLKELGIESSGSLEGRPVIFIKNFRQDAKISQK